MKAPALGRLFCLACSAAAAAQAGAAAPPAPQAAARQATAQAAPTRQAAAQAAPASTRRVAAQATPASTRLPDAASSPRWMYEIKAGDLHPDLDRYATYYGTSRSTVYTLGAAYRFRSWLEAGAEIGRMRESGKGAATGVATPSGSVTYVLTPVQLFASFMLDAPRRRFVPYLGVGIATAFYDERIDLQPDRDRRARVGPAARAGLRWRFAARGAAADAGAEAHGAPRAEAARRRGQALWRGYVFLEAQRFSSRIRRFDLGGTAYFAGVRVEFELGELR